MFRFRSALLSRGYATYGSRSDGHAACDSHHGCAGMSRDGRSRRERILVPAGNADALAERMTWFIEHPDRIEEMAGRSLKLCCEKYEIGRVNRTMLEILDII